MMPDYSCENPLAWCWKEKIRYIDKDELENKNIYQNCLSWWKKCEPFP